MKYNIENKTLVLLTILLTLYSCGSWQYAKGVLADNQTRLELHKSFIRSIEFKGLVQEMVQKKGKYGRRILIEMDTSFVDKIQFNPFYTINENKLDIVVSKELYDAVVLIDTLFKKNGSLSLVISNKNIQLVSSEEYIWLPR